MIFRCQFLRRKALLPTILTVGLLLLHPAVEQQSDTLELKDGRLLTGTYLGGSQNTIRFRVNDQMMVVSASDAVALTFDRRAAAAATPAKARTEAPKVPAASSAAVTVMAGTPLLIRTNDSIDSARHGTGHRFTGRLEFDLVAGGRVVAKKGAGVYGILAEAKKGGRLFRKAELRLALTDITIGSQRQRIETGGFGLKGEKQGTVGKVAVGAGIGRLARGNRKGARRGAAVGATGAALSSKQIRVPSGTLLEFQLKAPFTVQ
jgi:hypothetical protein